MSGPSPEYRAFVEAGIGLVMSVILSDGKYTQNELAFFVAAQHRHPLFRDVPPDAFNPMLQRVKSRLATESWRDLITEWAAAVPEPYRVQMFQLALEAMTVDKEIGGNEPEVVSHLWQALGVPMADAQRMFMSAFQKM